jgi:hypothetical protein
MEFFYRDLLGRPVRVAPAWSAECNQHTRLKLITPVRACVSHGL